MLLSEISYYYTQELGTKVEALFTQQKSLQKVTLVFPPK